MPDFVYLLENRLSADQRNALNQLRAVAREAGTLLFLTGDAVRDLTSGHAVHELEVVVHANALKLKKPIEKLGGKLWGEDEPSRTLYLCFPGTVRVDLLSAHRIEYPKPGKPVYHFASIQEDLRRRDFTANAMAISLNDGSYGLFMDPLNGAADIEARLLRLVSNYGFIEDPALLIRVTRYRARLGWEMDMRTQARYDNSKNENAIEALSPHARSQELEQIGHEEDGLKVLQTLESEGWMKVLFPAWTSARADEAKLAALHDLAALLQIQGVHPDMSAAQMQLLTAKLAPKDLSALKKSLLRPGFVVEWNSLDSIASAFSKTLLAKQNAKPSATYKLFMSYDPEAILWLGFTSKNKEVQERFNNFLKVWPEARQRIPYLLMQELRITPELPKFNDLVRSIFLELIDGRLTTPEEMRAYLEPHSPPAPPPQITIKRTRAKRGAVAKIKERDLDEDEDEDALPGDDDLDADAGDEDELDLGALPKGALRDENEESDEEEESDDEEEVAPRGKKQPAPPKGQKPAPGKPEKTTPGKPQPTVAAKGKPVAEPPAKSVAAKPEAIAVSKGKPVPAPVGKLAPAKLVPGKSAAAQTAPAKSAAKAQPAPAAKTQSAPAEKAKSAVPAKAAKPAAKPAPAKSAKPAAKAPAKKIVKPAPAKAPHHKPKPAKHAPAKSSRPAAKKPAHKPTKKR
jgi:tRNA nucleotidyltransferase (CCA-adding enzyme)